MTFTSGQAPGWVRLLAAVVSAVTIRDTLSEPGHPEQAVGQLIEPANEAGGPDNIACVVADVIEPRPG